MTIETKIEAEQVARGPIYLEIFPQMAFPPGGKHKQDSYVEQFPPLSSASSTRISMRTRAGFRDIEEGKLLFVTEVASLEARLRSDRNDWSARLTLLSYYYSSADLKMSKTQIVAARRSRILWAIQNRPSAAQIFELPELQLGNAGALADPAGAKEAQSAWQHQMAEHTSDQQIRLNAASFCARIDPSFSETVIESEIASAPPDSQRWTQVLGSLYAAQLASGQNSTFVAHARTVLLSSNDPDLTGPAAVMLVEQVLSRAAAGTRGKESDWSLVDFAEQLANKTASLESHNLVPLLLVLTAEVEISHTEEERLEAEKKVYKLFQNVSIDDSSSQENAAFLPIMANLAFDIKDDDAAMKYASKALELVLSQEHPGNAGKDRAEESGNHAVSTQTVPSAVAKAGQSERSWHFSGILPLTPALN